MSIPAPGRHRRRSRRALVLLVAAAATLILGGSAWTVVSLNRVAREHADERGAVARLRTDLVRAQSVGWHGLAVGAPDFSIATEARAIDQRLRRQARALRAAHDDDDHARIVKLVDELLDGIDAELRDLGHDHPGQARTALTTTLLSTSDLLDAGLAAAEQTATAQAASASARAYRGSLTALGLAAALLLLLGGAVRRSHRRASAAERDALRRSEERFRSLVEQSSEILVVVDADGIVLDVTDAAVQRLLGWDPATLRGRDIVGFIDAGDQQRIRSALQRLQAEPGPRAAFEVGVRHRDGHALQLEAVGNNLLATPTVRGLVLTLRDVTERRSMEDELRHQAFHDALTGLPNRALFDDRLAQALRRARRGDTHAAVVIVDLDDFKAVNDSLGHSAGDALLVECARRLDAEVRGVDTAARLGGDEFAVLVEDPDAERTAQDVARRLLVALAAPIDIDGRMLHVEASVGVALAEPGAAPEDALRNADIAMYAAKGLGGNELTVFRPEMLDAARERLDLREDLRHALDRGELTLHYQPVVALGDGVTRAVEALLRWSHPVHGAIPPVRFIPVAEDSGLIVPIGEWVLRRACADVGELERRVPGVRVAVNVSAVQLRERDFVDTVRAALADAALAPDRLVIELTESVFAGGEEIAQALQALRELGVGLSVDDFGTGYSSLSYLRRLDVDSVKIDRSFVGGVGAEPRDAALVRSIIELGHTLGLVMVAEGVEEDEQAEFLRASGCELAQGWLYGRPEPLLPAAGPLPPRGSQASSTSP